MYIFYIYIHIYIYIYICIYIYSYTYTYIYRERGRWKKESDHNFYSLSTWNIQQLPNWPNSFGISKLTVPSPVSPHYFSQIIKTFVVKIRPALDSLWHLFHKGENVKSWYCESNYSCKLFSKNALSQIFDRVLNMSRILNMPEF